MWVAHPAIGLLCFSPLTSFSPPITTDHLNKSIKAQGLRPPFVEASIEIDAEVASIRQSLKTLHKSEGTRYDSFARTHVELRIKEVNERIRGYNMTIPKGIPKKMPLELSRELERGKETEVGRKRRQRIEELAMDEAMKRFFDNL